MRMPQRAASICLLKRRRACVGVGGAAAESSECRVEEQATLWAVLAHLKQNWQRRVASRPTDSSRQVIYVGRIHTVLLMLLAIQQEELLASAAKQQRCSWSAHISQQALQRTAQ